MRNTQDFPPEPHRNRAILETKQCSKCRTRKEIHEFPFHTNSFGRKVYGRKCIACGGGPEKDSYSQPYRSKEKRAPKFRPGYDSPLGLLLVDLVKLTKDMARCEGSAIACKARGDHKTAKGRWVGYYINKGRVDHIMNLILQKAKWVDEPEER